MGELKIRNRYKRELSKKTMIGIVLFCMILIISDFIHQKWEMEEDLNDAIQYYNEGKYTLAASRLEEVLDRTEKLNEEIAEYLYQSYMKLGRYESAANVAQAYYEKKPSIEGKDKLELAVELLLEETYHQKLERGNKYLEANEYYKAITEYLSALQLKPQSEEVLTLIIHTYINVNEFEKAQYILDESKEKGNNSNIQLLQQDINYAYTIAHYHSLIEEADEYFYNGRTADCYETYEEAIRLLPLQIEAYDGLVNSYIAAGQYDTAVSILEEYETIYQFSELEKIKERITEQKENEAIIMSILKKLYYAISEENIDEMLSITHGNDYRTYIKQGVAYYYDALQKKTSSRIPISKGLIIYSSGTIYQGSFENGKRSDKGRLFMITNDVRGYFLYSGQWNNDLPNGQGVLYTTMQAALKDSIRTYNVIVQGNYRNGYENGIMYREFYLDSAHYGTLSYNCLSGIPQPMNEIAENYVWSKGFTYVIGELKTTDGTEEFSYNNLEERWCVPTIH